MLNSSKSRKPAFLTSALLCFCAFVVVFFSASILYAGVGGGVEAKETVNLIDVLKFTAIFLAGISAVFGVGLAFAAKRFAVQEDPRIDQVSEVLAHAHCGACGFAGCRQYAEAVVLNPEVAPNLCTPGGKASAEAVAKITGKEMTALEPKVARVFCQGGMSKSIRRFKYEGIADCKAAILASGGDKGCIYGCLGYGTCFRACPFGAITMSDDSLPIIDPSKCTACGKCAQACPVKVIEILPMTKGGYTGLRHGEAVALGMVAAMGLAQKLGRGHPDDAERLSRLLVALGLPVDLTGRVNERVLRFLGTDKKRRGGQLAYIIPGAPGRVDVVSMPLGEVRALLQVGT